MKPQHLSLALIALAFNLPANAGLLSDEYKQKQDHLKQLERIAQSLANTMQQQVPFKLNRDMSVEGVSALKNELIIRTSVHFTHQKYMEQESSDGPNQGWLIKEIKQRATAEVCNTPTLNDFIAVGGVVKIRAFRGTQPPSITGFGPYIDKCP